MSEKLTPVAWQKFGDEYCLTGQFGMRPIFLSVAGRRCGQSRPFGLRLLNMENMLLVPFAPDHPHAQRIVDGWNNTERFEALRLAAKAVLDDHDRAGVIMPESLNALRELSGS